MKTRRNGVEPGPSSSRRSQQRESSSTKDQRARILKALSRGPKTTDELRAIGIYQTSARIFELRRDGNQIATELFNGYAADGYSHSRMARYTLIGFKSPARSRDGTTGRTKGGA